MLLLLPLAWHQKLLLERGLRAAGASGRAKSFRSASVIIIRTVSILMVHGLACNHCAVVSARHGPATSGIVAVSALVYTPLLSLMQVTCVGQTAVRCCGQCLYNRYIVGWKATLPSNDRQLVDVMRMQQRFLLCIRWARKVVAGEHLFTFLLLCIASFLGRHWGACILLSPCRIPCEAFLKALF